MGVGLKFGVPFTELDTVYLAACLDARASPVPTSRPRTWTTPTAGYSSSPSADAGLVARLRDNAGVPNNGRYQRLLGELEPVRRCALPARPTTSTSSTCPLTSQCHLGVRGEVGWGKGLGGVRSPVFKNYYAGGLGSVRGSTRAPGPARRDGAFIGGTKKFVLNGEFITAVPGRRQRPHAAPVRLRRRRQRAAARRASKIAPLGAALALFAPSVPSRRKPGR